MNTYQNQGLSLKGMVIQLLATKAIDEHLQTLPSMVVNSINKTSAIASVVKFFSPLHNAPEDELVWEDKNVQKILEELISDSAAISVLRLI
ncbi:MAG: hypothetical protein ACRCT1_19585 [Microcoleaceae cyanobacterium]|jgi:hypothetical protein